MKWKKTCYGNGPEHFFSSKHDKAEQWVARKCGEGQPPLPPPLSSATSSPPPAAPLRVADDVRRDDLCAVLQSEGFLLEDVPLTPEVVCSSYRKFWLKHHPDKGGEPRGDIVDVF